jgi:CheY-like chemotaxis protein
MSVKLRASGFDPVVAYNGKEAIDAAAKIRPDLILMDINMPGQTGTDAALAIKQNPEMKDVKIAFLSSLKDPWPTIPAEREKIAKALGMEEYIDKGDDLNIMVAKVRKILGLVLPIDASRISA